MFSPEYFRVVGYIDNAHSGVMCMKCAEKEFGLTGDETEALLGRADLTAIYEADESDWSPDGLSCEDCGDYIFEPDICECDVPEPDRHEENCENCGGLLPEDWEKKIADAEDSVDESNGEVTRVPQAPGGPYPNNT